MINDRQLACIKNIIFDLDGTLIDSSEGVIEATNYALTSLGQKPRLPEEIKRFIGYPLDIMFPSFCDAPIAELKAAFQRNARESMIASSVPLPGVNKVLPLFPAKGLTMAIATTKFSIHTTGIVEKLGWGKYFAALVSGDEVKRVKPAPDIVELALARLEGNTADSIMIGDTVNDIKAAHAAGIKAIAIRSPFGNDDFGASEPDFILERFSDLKQLFGL
ncbi:MAG: HAD family hydrolase [FCB group bacterium]|nr:HAD family hydrolase [FCB group bacterium]